LYDEVVCDALRHEYNFYFIKKEKVRSMHTYIIYFKFSGINCISNEFDFEQKLPLFIMNISLGYVNNGQYNGIHIGMYNLIRHTNLSNTHKKAKANLLLYEISLFFFSAL